MFGETYPRMGLHTIADAVVLAPVNQGDPNPGLFSGLLDIFMVQDPDVHDPLRIRIHQGDKEWNAAMKEKVNSLVDKRVTVVINRSPWAACGKTGVVNYLQSIEEVKQYPRPQTTGGYFEDKFQDQAKGLPDHAHLRWRDYTNCPCQRYRSRNG